MLLGVFLHRLTLREFQCTFSDVKAHPQTWIQCVPLLTVAKVQTMRTSVEKIEEV